MRRRRRAPFRPILSTAEVALVPSLGDISGSQDCRALLVKIPDDWEFRRADEQRVTGEIETVVIKRDDPDEIPAGRYLRLLTDHLIDPWGRVAIGLEFDTPNGTQCAELVLQTQDEAMGQPATRDPMLEGIQLDAQQVLACGEKASVLFVEGQAGDMLDLSDDPSGRWSPGDNDGTHTLYVRSDRAGTRTAMLAVRNVISVKLA